MVQHPVPDDIVTLAEERAVARTQRDWAVADELKARIESAGWQVVDDGSAFSLTPKQPPDLVVGDETRYGSVASVPSRLEEADTGTVTIAVTASDRPEAVGVTVESVRQVVSSDRQLLLVANPEPSADGDDWEVIRGVDAFSAGEALSIVLRRATGAVIVVVEAGWVPNGDFIGPLSDVLGDTSVAVAGNSGLRSTDLHRYVPASAGEVTALAAGCYAFRRADARAAGVVDPRLQLATSVATWWSLVLRDAGPGAPPRRAVSLALPLTTAVDETAPTANFRLIRRDRYRITDLVGERHWLAAEAEEIEGLPGERPQGYHKEDHPDHAEHTPDA